MERERTLPFTTQEGSYSPPERSKLSVDLKTTIRKCYYRDIFVNPDPLECPKIHNPVQLLSVLEVNSFVIEGVKKIDPTETYMKSSIAFLTFILAALDPS